MISLVCPNCLTVLKAKLERCEACGLQYEWEGAIPNFMGESATDFTDERFEHMLKLEQEHFWFPPRRELLLRLVDKSLPLNHNYRIAELGCGSGWMFKARPHLSGAAVDGHLAGLQSLSAESRPDLLLAKCSVLKTPLPTGRFDLVAAFDVMEHTNDSEFLTEANRLLKRGGRIVLSVPACAWLWSKLDELAGHRKRYGKRDLTLALTEAGFRVRFLTCYQFFLFPVFVLSRLLGLQARERRIPGKLANSLLTFVNRVDAFFGSRFPLPWGSSLIAVAEKVS